MLLMNQLASLTHERIDHEILRQFFFSWNTITLNTKKRFERNWEKNALSTECVIVKFGTLKSERRDTRVFVFVLGFVEAAAEAILHVEYEYERSDDHG